MIIPDTNSRVYAYNSEIPQHSDAHRWWEEINDGTRSTGLDTKRDALGSKIDRLTYFLLGVGGAVIVSILLQWVH